MNPYTVLGINPGASADEAKIAFRTLAKTCHPDLHPNDPAAEARFKEINAAYDAITNPQPEQPHGGAPHWNFHFDPFAGFGHSPFEDLFGQFRQRQPTIFHVTMKLEDVLTGKEATLQMPNGREIKVKVPAGVEDGMCLVVHGAGQPTPNGQAADVNIIIRVQPHERFTRHAHNILTMIPVTAFDVLLENEIEVIGIDGSSMRVTIPANFDTTRKLRLAGQGLPNSTGQRGDLLVDLFIQFPKIPTDKIEALRKISGSI